MNICALYVADDANQSTQVLENQIPFTQNLQIEDDEPEVTYDVKTNIADFRADVVEDADGDKRMLALDANIDFVLSGYVTKECEVLTDAYSLTKNFDLDYEVIDTPLKIGDVATQFVLKEVVSKSEEDPNMSEVINVNGPSASGCDCGRWSCNGRGFVFCNVLYPRMIRVSDCIFHPADSIHSDL